MPCRTLYLLLSALLGLALSTSRTSAASNCIDGIAAWWQFEGNGNDAQGASVLTLNNGAAFGMGEVGQGLLLDGADDYARANASAALNVGAGSGMSIEM